MTKPLFATLLLLAGCGGGGSDAPADLRVLALHASEASDGDFDAAVDLAVAAGARAAHLHLDWSQLETAPGVYDDTFPVIANLYYPARELPLYLTLRPINTVRREVPADLANTLWDDPAMIDRFRALLDMLFARMPDVEFAALAVGNEIDGVLAGPADYAAYKTFFTAVRAHARSLRPGLSVGATAMFPGLTGGARDALRDLNAAADFVSVTYYPLDAGFVVRPPATAGADFDALVALYPGRTIVFQECGYPSSPACSSSEAMQRDFVVEVFGAWDRHRAAISHVALQHLHDWSTATVDEFLVYYGDASPGFRGYLDSLGLRARDGTPKPAWDALVAEAAARGFSR